MSFNEVYSILKKENIDKICFVETGSFFVTIGSDAECMVNILELSKICFSSGVCKVGFPTNSLSKYMKIMYNMRVPYVVYGYLEEESSTFNVEIEHNGKKYTKLADISGDLVIAERIAALYRTFKPNCNRCEYKKNKLLKEIKSCDRRKEKLKLELHRMLLNETINKQELNIKEVSTLKNISLFDLPYNNESNM